jgi:hypothetical protein
MTLRSEGTGSAVVLPCIEDIAGLDDLMTEAEALWQAEARNKEATGVGSAWGCVGILFRAGVDDHLVKAWSSYFQSKVKPFLPVDDQGLLRIPWPPVTTTGTPAEVDVILATATGATLPTPTVADIAGAWVDHGHEEYFFNNVLNGIRTPDDASIWKQILKRNPRWLMNKAYENAISSLRSAVPDSRSGQG